METPHLNTRARIDAEFPERSIVSELEGQRLSHVIRPRRPPVFKPLRLPRRQERERVQRLFPPLGGCSPPSYKKRQPLSAN